MKIVQGNLTLLGNSVIHNTKITEYSVIEIGDQTLQKVKVPRSLDNYLSRALTQQGITKLFLNGKLLCGVGTPDGKLYCYKAKPIAALILCICGIPLIPVLGLGLFFIWQGIGEFRNAAAMSELKAQGAVPISL